MTEYVIVHAPGLVLYLTRAEFFKGIDRGDRRLPRGSIVLESSEVVRREGE